MSDASDKKDAPNPITPDYLSHLMMKKDKGKLKEYSSYVKEHRRRLKRLEREASGEFVPEDDYE